MIKIKKFRLRNLDNKHLKKAGGHRPKRCENQASSQKFRQQTPEEGRRTYRPKRCGNNNKDEDNSPKTLNDKNQQASSQKFSQQTPK